MQLMKGGPTREIQWLAARMNRLLDGRFMMSGDREWALPVDLIEEDDSITVTASVPGVKPEDLDVSIENNTLTIKGKTASGKAETKGRWLMRELRHGEFFRSIRLPDLVDEDKASVTLRDGELIFVVPLAETRRGKRLAVKAGSQTTPI